MRNVTKEVVAVQRFLNLSPSIDIFNLRNTLAGTDSEYTSPHLEIVESLLVNWPHDEIAQFTDFLINEKFIEKQAVLINEVPFHHLIPSHNAENIFPQVAKDIFFPVYEVSPNVPVTDKKTTRKPRHHDLPERRFFPKKLRKP